MKLFSWIKRFRKHQHVWDKVDDNPFKRRCPCGREEWLFTTAYPSTDRPSAEWRDMTIKGDRFDERK